MTSDSGTDSSCHSSELPSQEKVSLTAENEAVREMSGRSSSAVGEDLATSLSDEPTTPKSCTPRKISGNSCVSNGSEGAVRALSAVRGHKLRVARSPRPHRMKAVDWCPPPSSPYSKANSSLARAASATNSSNNNNSNNSWTGQLAASTVGMPSDKTVATSRAVRGDDATITTYATMTTMGDAGSILEADTEDEDETSEDGEQRSNEEEEMMDVQDDKDEVVVDRLPSFAGTVASLLSGVTNAAVRGSADISDRSIVSYSTMNTFADLGSIYEEGYYHEKIGFGPTSVPIPNSQNVVDTVPSMTSTPGTSVISAATTQAFRDQDDRSFVSLATQTTMGYMINTYDFDNQAPNSVLDTLVDRTPSNTAEAGSSVVSGTTNHSIRGDEASDTSFSTIITSGRERNFSLDGRVVDHIPSMPSYPLAVASIASATTGNAVRLNEDQSVATWNTMTSAVLDHTNEHVVDRTPFRDDITAEGTTKSATTGNAIKASDDLSVATWNTMTTVGVSSNAVDRVPSQSNQVETSMSAVTSGAVRAPDDQSVVTFATQTTSGMDKGNRMVDKIPSISEKVNAYSSVTSGTTSKALSNQSMSWTTNTTTKNIMTGNIVDKIPTFVVEETSYSSKSIPTTNAVLDEQSVNTIGTSIGMGERGIQEIVDRIPTYAGGAGRSVVSGITNQAVKLNDDCSIASFNTMTTGGDLGNTYVDPDRREQYLRAESDSSNSNRVYRESSKRDSMDDGEDDMDVMGNLVSSSSRPTAPSGILREGRHNRQSALRESGGFSTPPAAFAAAGALLNVGESVSNTHILRAITDLRFHIDYRIGELRELNRRDQDRVVQIVQQEQAKRTALEARLHSQLLWHSESMVAMELKLLRLEAKVSHKEMHRQRRQPSVAGIPMTDRLPPIAATPSSPNQSDEEVDSFEELDLTPRANRQGFGAGSFSQSGPNRGPANIAVVTRSGASVASAVTATSFAEGDFAQMQDEEERSVGSEDGDDEDIYDQNDGSASTPTLGSSNRISNIESILLNPLTSMGNNDQGISTRATRGETDGMSSLPTSVTSATMASTVITATTRGESVGIIAMSSRASEDDNHPENIIEDNDTQQEPRNMQFNSNNMVNIDSNQYNQTRSRSQSPLTVQSAANETIGTQSVASVSLGPSILSTAAVASSRLFSSRRATAELGAADRNEGRSLADRVVSFTTNDMVEHLPRQENDAWGDSITIPDEYDSFSDVADAFSNSSRLWREDYEARLDAINKRLGN